jgi:hypothetical protein
VRLILLLATPVIPGAVFFTVITISMGSNLKYHSE